MYHESMRYCQGRIRHRSPSVIGAIIRFVVFVMLGIAVLAGGLWMLGAAIGLVIGLFALAISLAPILLVGWLVWLVIKAIFL